MDNVIIEVKQSKGMFIAACIACSLFEIIWGGMLIFVIASIENGRPVTNDDYFGYIYMLCFFCILFIAFVFILIYIIYRYRLQKDIYTQEKMYRKMADKIIFEIPYSQIETIREGYCLIFFVLKKGIVKTNGKKGPRNFLEHYSNKDISKIERMISQYKELK